MPFGDRPASPKCSGRYARTRLQELNMGKYVIGWLLGVPAIVLVVLYLFFH
jgi:hypothetical protein